MQKAIYGLIVFIVPQMFTGCGSENSKLDSDSTVYSKVLVVLSSGRDTCEPSPQNEYTPLKSRFYKSYLHSKRFIQGLRPSTIIDEVMSCYLPDGKIWYRDIHHKLYRTNESGFFDFLENEFDDYHSRFMVGHSYGGWLNMYIAEATKLDYNTVFTVDPISKVQCSFTSPLGCQSYPQDFNKSMREKIRSRSKEWINSYQDRTWYLHSSSIPEAHRNIKINRSHTDIVEDTAIWNLFNEAILETL